MPSHDIWNGRTPPAFAGTAPAFRSFLPDRADGTPAPAILVLPGGGYAMHAEYEGDPIALWLNGFGIAAFVLEYRVAPDRHPAPLLDARRAIQFIRANAAEFGIDPSRVGVLGFSAGGHLAASLSLPLTFTETAGDQVDAERPEPDLAVLCYPVISLVDRPHPGSVANLLGSDTEDALAQALSADRQASAATPPTFLWHTAEDGSVPVTHSLQYATRLAEQGVPFELHVFPHGRHGLALADDDPPVAQWLTLLRTWLGTLGW